MTFKVEDYNGGTPTLLSTTYSWTKVTLANACYGSLLLIYMMSVYSIWNHCSQVANIIFLDQPVGTGFSYATTQLLDTPSDSGEAKQIHEFIRKVLK